jgi:hypothetical protein
VRWSNDFVAGFYSQRAQANSQGVGAAANTDRVLNLAMLGKVPLEAFDFAAEDIGATVQNARNRGENRIPVRTVLRGG